MSARPFLRKKQRHLLKEHRRAGRLRRLVHVALGNVTRALKTRCDALRPVTCPGAVFIP